MNPYILAAILALGFGAGWQVNEWRHDAVELAAQSAAELVAATEQNREARIAAAVVKSFEKITVKERHTERVIREVTKREIYLTDCIDPDGLDIINGVHNAAPPAR